MPEIAKLVGSVKMLNITKELVQYKILHMDENHQNTMLVNYKSWPFVEINGLFL